MTTVARHTATPSKPLVQFTRSELELVVRGLDLLGSADADALAADLRPLLAREVTR